MIESGNHIPLSIAIPSYNRRLKMLGLLKSIQEQAGSEDEIIVADDGSTDGSAEEANKIAGIRVISQNRNQGMVANWNACLGAATQDWICIIHDDDTLEPEGIETLRRVCKIAGRPALILPTGRQSECDESFRYSFWSSGPWSVLNCPMIPSGAVIHRQIIKQLGIFNPQFAYSSDLEYFPRIASHFPLFIIESPLAIRYNLHDSNYQVETWKKADFVLQLEQIQRSIVSYARMDGPAAERLVRERLILNFEFIVREGYRRGDEALVRHYRGLLAKLGKPYGGTAFYRLRRFSKRLFKLTE